MAFVTASIARTLSHVAAASAVVALVACEAAPAEAPVAAAPAAAAGATGMQARFTPAFEDGAPVGFRISSTAPDSHYARLGLKDGDVLVRVNGAPLNQPEKGLDLFEQLKAPTVTVDVKRQGQLLTLTKAD